jgi:hypothetical protein
MNTAAIASNVRLRSSQSRKLSGATGPRAARGGRSQTITRRSGSGNGSGRISVASTSANIALFAPMPSASVMAASAVNPGARRNCRSANLRSFHTCSSHPMVFM